MNCVHSEDHPYNRLMEIYLYEKLHEHHANMPQIVGLTASPGSGKAKTLGLDATQKHILGLCANLDAQAFVTVRNQTHERTLREKVAQPEGGMLLFCSILFYSVID